MSTTAPSDDTTPDAATGDRFAREVADLRAGARTWTALTLGQRAGLLRAVRRTVGAAAEDWATTAAATKGLSPTHPLRGEEWLSGPYATLGALDGYIATLERLARGGSPLDGVPVGTAPGGRVRARVFPARPIDSVLLSGFSGEIWLRPDVSVADAARTAGLAQLSPSAPAELGLVLGAGNITSIPVLDVLYELLAENRVVLLKVNPTQDLLVPIFERALAPLIEPGLLRIVRGDGEVGAALTQHPAFSHIHITGSAATFDAIVWGTGEDAAARRAADDPRLTIPITAELGGVAPIIVVPGAWTAADLRFQAEHIATMRLQNSGHNCIAGQVVIVSSDWPQREEFLRALHAAYAEAPERPVWYPHATERMAAAAAAHPTAQHLADGTRLLVQVADPDDAHDLETTEYFAPVLGVIALPGTGQEFLDAAVAHANDRLVGTLGANVLIDPDTEAELGAGFERAIADLRYGGIAINAWTGVVFATTVLSWGAFPGGTREDVGSGIGVVHNTLLLDGIERSVLRGPFRPFPRSLTGGGFSILPTPPWFVSSRTAAAVSEGLTRYQIGKSPAVLAATLIKALGA
ncbi:aldehyde dehydrogenase family protein [Microbacterium caowuchunii]|uniref:Aldehyde dehydrogenase family protein n=1 Tax=Microbacterium caowuchunii TaxID=2614638 RepID=A0A5N0T661_9MICO|nr:aldehyde dehydrogenase family protein [Microbacterium caowuchunii]KAA9130352.1 aldehyde dehydrogenase family protein [Microbacterium caowuchunii]